VQNQFLKNNNLLREEVIIKSRNASRATTPAGSRQGSRAPSRSASRTNLTRIDEEYNARFMARVRDRLQEEAAAGVGGASASSHDDDVGDSFDDRIDRNGSGGHGGRSGGGDGLGHGALPTSRPIHIGGGSGATSTRQQRGGGVSLAGGDVSSSPSSLPSSLPTVRFNVDGGSHPARTSSNPRRGGLHTRSASATYGSIS
jgi:hypothetical protein